MATKSIENRHKELSDREATTALALGVLIDRIGSLPKADRDDLFELVKALKNGTTEEDRQSIRVAMEEILNQVPVTATRMPMDDSQPPKLKRWTEHVGAKIRELRKKAGMTQDELATKASILQPHLSRLENAEHSPTHKTLKKIAKALATDVAQLDPCIE